MTRAPASSGWPTPTSGSASWTRRRWRSRPTCRCRPALPGGAAAGGEGGTGNLGLQGPAMNPPQAPRGRVWSAVRHWLGLERNIVVMLAVILIVGLGEELWVRFVPAYLAALGATAWGVAIYGTLKDLLDGIYQYPGGWLADRLGRRRALMLFTLAGAVGY